MQALASQLSSGHGKSFYFSEPWTAIVQVTEYNFRQFITSHLTHRNMGDAAAPPCQCITVWGDTRCARPAAPESEGVVLDCTQGGVRGSRTCPGLFSFAPLGLWNGGGGFQQEGFRLGNLNLVVCDYSFSARRGSCGRASNRETRVLPFPSSLPLSRHGSPGALVRTHQ